MTPPDDGGRRRRGLMTPDPRVAAEPLPVRDLLWAVAALLGAAELVLELLL